MQKITVTLPLVGTVSDHSDLTMNVMVDPLTERVITPIVLADNLHSDLFRQLPDLSNLGSSHSSDYSLVAEIDPAPTLPIKEQPQVNNTIAVYSAKGGVGKSSVALQLALALQSTGASTGILDLDVYGPSLAQTMPEKLGQSPELISTEDGTKNFKPFEVAGLDILSIANLLPPGKAAMWRGPMASGAVKQLMSQCRWRDLHYLVLDLPPGTGDIPLTLAQNNPPSAAVFVTTPAEVAVEDTNRSIELFRKLEIPMLGIVVNMSHTVCTKCGDKSYPFGNLDLVHKLSEQNELPVLAELPLTDSIGVDVAKPWSIDTPEASATQDALLALAYNVALKLHVSHQKETHIPLVVED